MELVLSSLKFKLSEFYNYMMRVIFFILLLPSAGFSQKEFPKDFKHTGPETGTIFNPGMLIDLNGDTVDFNRYSAKVIYINFWFVGCKGCKQEEAYIEELSRTLTDNPDVVMFAFVPNRATKITAYLKKKNPYVNFLIFPMNDFKTIEEKFRVGTYPTHFIVSNNILIENFTVPLSQSRTAWVTNRIREEAEHTKRR